MQMKIKHLQLIRTKMYCMMLPVSFFMWYKKPIRCYYVIISLDLFYKHYGTMHLRKQFSFVKGPEIMDR